MFKNLFKYQMHMFLILSLFFSQGCILLAIPVAVGTVQLVRKAASTPTGRSEKERLAIEYREFKCNKDKMVISLRSVLTERNLRIVKDSESDKKVIEKVRENGGVVGGSVKIKHEEPESGNIEAQTDNPFLNAKLTYSRKFDGIIGVRFVVSNDKGIIENNSYYEDFFEDLSKSLKTNSQSK